MSRYIDADAIEYHEIYDGQEFVRVAYGDDIDNIPSADVVEVVRCKDCKWYAGDGMYCANNIIVQFDNFYCYSGERREDAEIH